MMPGRWVYPNIELDMLLSVFRPTDFDSALTDSEFDECGLSFIQISTTLVEVSGVGLDVQWMWGGWLGSIAG